MQATTFACPLSSIRCTTSGIPAYSAAKQFHATHNSCVQHAASVKEHWHPFLAAIQETGSYIDLFSLQGEEGQM
jgi:hypothetical protein